MDSTWITDDIRQTYSFGPEIGKGNYATVIKGELKGEDMPVAIKIIAKNKSMEENTTFIQRQTEILFKLEHENIIKLYEVYDNKDAYYIVMEYMDGKDVYERYVTKKIRDQPSIYKIIRVVTEALQYCHSSDVIHRDLKPQNILLSSQQQPFTFKIADFGLARFVGDDMLNTACGTPAYIAPEILKGQPYDKKADFWSLGILMYTLLCGDSPYPEPDPKKILTAISSGVIKFNSAQWDKVSKEAKDLIVHLLNTNPKERYGADQVLKHPWIKAQGKLA